MNMTDVEKKKKLKLTKKKAVPVGYNPLIHTSLLGKRDKDMQRQDYSRPMPYNEKLRRARGSLEDAMAIADSQVGKVDVLKGRFRNVERGCADQIICSPGLKRCQSFPNERGLPILSEELNFK